jgi:hypothetical protein
LVLLNVVDGDVAAAQERVRATQIGIQQSHAHRVWARSGPCVHRQFCTCCWYRGRRERERSAQHVGYNTANTSMNVWCVEQGVPGVIRKM